MQIIDLQDRLNAAEAKMAFISEAMQFLLQTENTKAVIFGGYLIMDDIRHEIKQISDEADSLKVNFLNQEESHGEQKNL